MSVLASAIPGIVLDVELSAPLPSVTAHDALGHRRSAVWVVVRLFTEPLAMVTIPLTDAGLSAEELLAALVEPCREALTTRLDAVGLGLSALDTAGLTLSGPPPFVADRESALAVAPPVTVVICTREHSDALHACLTSLVDQEFTQFDVLVVDNAPTSGKTRQVVEEFADRLTLRYAVEPRPGLSRARNHALSLLTGDRIVAWTDDDVRVDRHWVAETVRAFVENPMASAVSGAVVPAELETQPQIWFEQFGGHSKGRGFTPDSFGPDSFGPGSRQSPLYPLPAFGVGANMAFRLSALRALGGFDDALGAGTPAQGGEDTQVFTRLLVRGGTTLYRPSMLVRHVHRADLAGLRAQMSGYGAGLTAFYASLIRANPAVVFPLIGLLPRAIRDLTSKDSVRVSTVREDFPSELFAANRRGMLVGPWRYLQGLRAARRLDAGMSLDVVDGSRATASGDIPVRAAGQRARRWASQARESG